MSGLLSMAGTARGATYLAIILVVASALAIAGLWLKVDFIQVLHKIFNWSIRLFGRLVTHSERKYYRDVTIGRLNEKKKKVKLYRKLNDLIIDLGLKARGMTPYEFLFIVAVVCAMIAVILGGMIESVAFVILVYPPVFIGVLCGLYTKANLAHDSRIEAVIEAENIISNNIKGGVVQSVRMSIDLMPSEVKDEFRDFLDNVEQKNYYIVTALMELNNNLGTISDDFIKKCIMFETEEEHGYSGVFKDLVEVNTIKTEIRNEVKRRFEVVQTEFIISASITAVFLLAFIAIYPILQSFYLKSLIGNLVIVIDALLIVLVFVYITKLKAEEL